MTVENAEIPQTEIDGLTVQVMYSKVAHEFAARISDIFATEDTLRALHDSYFPALPFDRTERWDHMLRQELYKTWYVFGPEVRTKPTTYDVRQILFYLSIELDFNLFTQVYLNLQPNHFLNYKRADAEAVVKDLQTKWFDKAPSPFDAKPKMFKAAASVEQQEFNRDLSTLKALNIIAKSSIGGRHSFRVSPASSTPTLVDSENISMLGVGGDQYLNVPPTHNAFYVTWDVTPTIIIEEHGGEFTHPDITYRFASKSGGDILNASLFARWVTAELYTCLSSDEMLQLVPRMNSVLVLTTRHADHMEVVLKLVQQHVFPGLELHEGVRREKALKDS